MNGRRREHDFATCGPARMQRWPRVGRAIVLGAVGERPEIVARRIYRVTPRSVSGDESTC